MATFNNGLLYAHIKKVTIDKKFESMLFLCSGLFGNPGYKIVKLLSLYVCYAVVCGCIKLYVVSVLLV